MINQVVHNNNNNTTIVIAVTAYYEVQYFLSQKCYGLGSIGPMDQKGMGLG
jgi:hypothetical protein